MTQSRLTRLELDGTPLFPDAIIAITQACLKLEQLELVCRDEGRESGGQLFGDILLPLLDLPLLNVSTRPLLLLLVRASIPTDSSHTA